MKQFAILIAIVGLSAGSARAGFDPGAPNPIFDPSHSYVLLDDSLEGSPSGTTFSTTATGGDTIHGEIVGPAGSTDENVQVFRHFLNAAVIEGDLVLGENGVPTSDRSTWSDVVRFYNVNGVGVADVYSWEDFTSFGNLNANVKYLAETFVPGSESPNYHGGMFTEYKADAPTLPINTYYIESVVPEPTTMIAGALLLLPFGMSTIRILRGRRAA